MEIVALRFLGVPLKEIGRIRGGSAASLGERLRAQRETLEVQRGRLARAITAIGKAEQALDAGAVDASVFRQIIEVMNMDTNTEDTITRYTALLKAKMAHLQSLTTEERDRMRTKWAALVAEITASLDQDPAGAPAQSLLDRWMAMLAAVSGTDPSKMGAEAQGDAPFKATRELRDAMWARRAEWLPEGTSADRPAPSGASITRLSEIWGSGADSRVRDFLARARAARG